MMMMKGWELLWGKAEKVVTVQLREEKDQEGSLQGI